MRLYRERSPEEKTRVMGLVTKKEVRKWLDERPTAADRA
jgi:hypothetical protein